jgi:hypothetical protein
MRAYGPASGTIWCVSPFLSVLSLPIDNLTQPWTCYLCVRSTYPLFKILEQLCVCTHVLADAHVLSDYNHILFCSCDSHESILTSPHLLFHVCLCVPIYFPAHAGAPSLPHAHTQQQHHDRINRTHGDAGTGNNTTNNGLEANNDLMKRINGGEELARMTVPEVTQELFTTIEYLSSRDSHPAPLDVLDPGFTDFAKKKYVSY